MKEALEQSDLREGYKTVKLGPREIPVPSEWEAVPFEEAIELNPRYDKTDNGPFDYLPMDAVDEEKQTIEYWTQRKKGDCTTTWFKNGDTVYAKITPCTENGKIAFIDGLTTKVGSGSTEFLVFHPREGITDERFVYYFANLPEFRAVTISLMEGSTGRQRVPSDVFKGGLKIPLPPLPEQRRIADILSTVDKQIQQTDEIIEETKRLREGLMQDLYSSGIGNNKFGSHQVGPREIEIPSHWDIRSVDELKSTTTPKKAIRGGPPGGRIKKSDRSEKGAKLYVQENVIHNDFERRGDYLSTEKFEELRSAEVDPGDVLITRSGTIGKSEVFPDDAQRGILGSSLIRIKVNKDIIRPQYLSQFLADSHIAQSQIQSMSHGGTRTGLNNKIVKSIQVPVPPIDEQDRISEILEDVEKKIQQEKQHRDELKDLKRGLMQDLLTGKVRVNSN
jgi:type I restriction enzyme S subunit